MTRVLTAALLFISCALVACDSTDPAADEIADIRMLPETVTMSVGDTTDFSVVAVTASGEVIENAELDLKWWSSDTDVFTVDDKGVAIAKGGGDAYCIAETNAPSKAALVVPIGRDSGFVTVMF